MFVVLIEVYRIIEFRVRVHIKYVQTKLQKFTALIDFFYYYLISGLEGWRLLQQVSQLKWTLLAKGQAVMNESELAALVLNMFIQMCHFYPSKDEDGAVIRPLPKIKQALSDPLHLPHVVQLLLTFDPTLVERVAALLHLVLEDNSR